MAATLSRMVRVLAALTTATALDKSPVPDVLSTGIAAPPINLYFPESISDCSMGYTGISGPPFVLPEEPVLSVTGVATLPMSW